MSQVQVRKAVIPVAGLGTRFLPVTRSIPKEMIPVVDTPVIHHIVEEAVRAGITDIVLVTARHKEAIENYFDHNYELEERLEKKSQKELAQLSRSIAQMCNLTAIRQKSPAGLGDAILCAESMIGQEPFAILLGDDLIDSTVPCIGQLMRVYAKEQASVVGVMEVPPKDVSKYGIVGGRALSAELMEVEKLLEKPSEKDAPSLLAIPGRYVLNPSIFNCLRQVKPGKQGELQLTDGLQLLAQQERLLSFRFEGTRYDAGDRLGWLDANLAFALKRPELAPGVKALLKKYSEAI